MLSVMFFTQPTLLIIASGLKSGSAQQNKSQVMELQKSRDT